MTTTKVATAENIRDMKAEDMEAAFCLWRQTRGVHLTHDEDKDSLGTFLARNPGLSQIALHGGEVVGVALCGHDGLTGFIHHLAVRQKSKLSGIGSRLVRNCLIKLEQIPVTKCQIIVSQENQQALKFWNHTGWELVADRLIMQKGERLDSNHTAVVAYKND